MKIYNCSNNHEYNDIILSLMENSRMFKHRFVSKASSSELIITNDYFSLDIKDIPIPKIKIMDSLICNPDLSMNDKEQIDAIEIADHVIFTSKAIKNNLFKLYPDIKIKDSSVILRISDKNPFKTNGGIIPDVETIIAVANDWSLSEKRLDSLLEFISNIPQKLYLLGKCKEDVPNNVVTIEKFDDVTLHKILMESQVMIDLSYKDFSSYYVSKAIASGIPIIYTDSGGLSEIVQFGVIIDDSQEIEKYSHIPSIDKMRLMIAFNEIRTNFKSLYKQDRKTHLAMITNYYNVFSKYEKRT